MDKYHFHEKGTERTLASICKLFGGYFDARVDKSKAKDYGNVVHLPLINIQDDTTSVLHVVPELHLMLGHANTLFDEMSKVWPASGEWLHGCYVKKSEYHGGQFEGNDCKKLLKKIELLQELCPHEHHQFVDAFISFNDVVTSCYSKDLLPQYKTNLSNFKDAYLKLKISVTPKIHAVFYHVEELCNLTNMCKLANHCIKSSKSVGGITWLGIWNIFYTERDCYKQCRCSTALIFNMNFIYMIVFHPKPDTLLILVLHLSFHISHPLILLFRPDDLWRPGCVGVGRRGFLFIYLLISSFLCEKYQHRIISEFFSNTFQKKNPIIK